MFRAQVCPWWRTCPACTGYPSESPAPSTSARRICITFTATVRCFCLRETEQMARIDLVDLAHSYNAQLSRAPASQTTGSWALKPMTMTWNDGGAYALLGPSGCGKTTLLNIISGLVRPTCGRVLFDGREVTALAPEARNIAQVFQFPVIYDTMTVYENLAFPLRNRRWPPADIRKRVHEIAAILELDANLHRRARGLSAETKQKISLGRGL